MESTGWLLVRGPWKLADQEKVPAFVQDYGETTVLVVRVAVIKCCIRQAFVLKTYKLHLESSVKKRCVQNIADGGVKESDCCLESRELKCSKEKKGREVVSDPLCTGKDPCRRLEQVQ